MSSAHVQLKVEDLEDGRCACMVARTCTFFLAEEDERVAYCETCKKQIMPSDREAIYNSHFTYHEGWGFVVMNRQDISTGSVEK